MFRRTGTAGTSASSSTIIFPTWDRLATAIFLKGYQWPFDPRKVAGLRLFAHRPPRLSGNRREGPAGFSRFPAQPGRRPDGSDDFSFAALGPEALAYLEKSGALQATPIERLKNMNPPAIEIYRSHGIDLEREMLEIAVCAQHNNGGLKGDLWWESNIRHLFPVGEVNGTHGVGRPGGSALNAGQVGSLRAALFIATQICGTPRPGKRVS